MSRSRASTSASQSHTPLATEFNWKEIRGTPSKPVKFDLNNGTFKKDELSSDKLSKLNIILNKVENKSIKLRNHYLLVKELDETMSWCDDFIDKGSGEREAEIHF